MNNEYKALYEAVSNKFSIGTFEEFEARMQSPEDRKRFYDAVSKKGFSLGGYDEYEERLKKKKRLLRNRHPLGQKKLPHRKTLLTMTVSNTTENSKSNSLRKLLHHQMFLFLRPLRRAWSCLKKLVKLQKNQH
jgi:hypothetical protein